MSKRDDILAAIARGVDTAHRLADELGMEHRLIVVTLTRLQHQKLVSVIGTVPGPRVGGRPRNVYIVGDRYFPPRETEEDSIIGPAFLGWVRTVGYATRMSGIAEAA